MRIDTSSTTLRSFARWFLVGAIFPALTIPVLYLFKEVLGVPLLLASLLTWEIGTILRFFCVDRWGLQAAARHVATVLEVSCRGREQLRRVVGGDQRDAEVGGFIISWRPSSGPAARWDGA
jgi:hypothetical protein